jgi:hypothetical protein
MLDSTLFWLLLAFRWLSTLPTGREWNWHIRRGSFGRTVYSLRLEPLATQ